MNVLSIAMLELAKVILTPSITLITALAMGVLLLWSPFQTAGRWLTTIVGGILLCIAILPLGSWIAKPLETRFSPIQQVPESIVGIILLGGAFEPRLSSEWGQPQINGHAGRLFAFVALEHKYPKMQMVFSGGPAAFGHQLLTESDVARNLFRSLGVDTSRIVFEDRSRNTCENAIYTAHIMNPVQSQTWALVTSAMDMPRAVGAFRKAGFRVLPYPADYTTNRRITLGLRPTLVSNLDQLDHAAHEWLGLLGYRLWGCTDALFPGP
jgi:uncharacterized SAM-binding protein YcdF (DUF218 family)